MAFQEVVFRPVVWRVAGCLLILVKLFLNRPPLPARREPDASTEWMQ